MSRLKSALVTGATTPLGRSLCARLLASGCEVLAVGLEAESAARFLIPEAAAYAAADLAKPRELHDLVFGPAKARSIDTVFHLATHRSLGVEGERVHALNVEALRQLIAHCEAHPTIARLVYRSYAEVYRVDQRLPNVIDEEHPLDHGAGRPQWLRDRVEADGVACARMGMTKLEIAVLRCADVFASGTGSQIYDYVRSRVCFKPLGFDPMINLLSLEDAAEALFLAGAAERGQGVFNVPGADTMPLGLCIRSAKRIAVPLPGPLLLPLYALRRRIIRTEFSYGLYKGRMHFPGILDGRRAREVLGFQPAGVS
ncbi:MAG: NAD-dependent epimerase/dehydratase family protein [Deltaproteobacteria bacterium]|nr:NAD-dependent epimerase/dehydratase family protein [Deltaproteobacteria bacterium]